MDRPLLKASLVWGGLLWLAGYLLGIVLFFLMPTFLIGWAILPIGVGITLWVLLNRVEAEALRRYLVLAIVWTAMAVVLDYLLIVKVFGPPDGSYKLDVYLYTGLTFVLPLAVGWWKTTRSHLQLAA